MVVLEVVMHICLYDFTIEPCEVVKPLNSLPLHDNRGPVAFVIMEHNVAVIAERYEVREVVTQPCALTFMHMMVCDLRMPVAVWRL